MNMIITDETKIAAQFALEWSKQLITLSTGLLAISITFTKDLAKNVKWWPSLALAASWACLLISINAGIGTMGALISGMISTAERTSMTSGTAWSKSVADRYAQGAAFDDKTLADAGIHLNPSVLKYGVTQRDFFQYGVSLLVLYGVLVGIQKTITNSEPHLGDDGPEPG